MHTRPLSFRIGAVALAITLAGSYIWFRVLQARAQTAAVHSVAPTTGPSTAATIDLTPGSVLPGSKGGILHGSKSGQVLPGSKSFIVLPSTTAPGAQPPATAPMTREKFLIYSSKSAPVNLIPQSPATAPSR